MQFVDNKDTNCFPPMDKGDNLISFEPPFITSCYDIAPGWVFDAPIDGDEYEGMYMSWAMKYIITLNQEIQVTGFGLVFNQHCTDRSRLSKEPYLAEIFKQLLAKLGEKKLDGLNSYVTEHSECPSLASATSEVQDAKSVIHVSETQSSTALAWWKSQGG